MAASAGDRRGVGALAARTLSFRRATGPGADPGAALQLPSDEDEEHAADYGVHEGEGGDLRGGEPGSDSGIDPEPDRLMGAHRVHVPGV